MTQRRTPASSSYPKRPYDLVREVSVAFLAVTVLTVILAAVFSSPDRPALTLASWAKVAPNDVVATAAGELAGTTTSAGYGPPYNTVGTAQSLWFIQPGKWAGITQPLDSAKDLVIAPLSTQAGNAALQTALTQWRAASADTQTGWATSYSDALAKVSDPAQVAKGNYGPVPVLATQYLQLARAGTLDGLLGPTAATGNDTRRLLLLADGSYMADQAQAEHLSGDQWGMMNETGNYPGQPWLWAYSLWYQVPGLSTSPNADVIVGVIMAVLTAGLLFVPFIPGLRSVPRMVRIHRIIWRRRVD